MQLTDHFSLEELTITAHRNINNVPNDPIIFDHLGILAHGLERVRARLGYPLHINSGYRCEELNTIVGGSPTSAHKDGLAADWICPQFGAPLIICRELVNWNEFQFDQIIQEGTWVHLSFAPAMRRVVLTKKGSGYKHGL